MAALARCFGGRRDSRRNNRRHWRRRSGRNRVHGLAEIGDFAQQLEPMT
jgi:hypothetical protein